MKRRKTITERDVKDYDDLQDLIGELYEEYGHEDFMLGNSVIDLADDILGKIHKDSDYRYLRLFNNHELEVEIQGFKDDMEQIHETRKAVENANG